MSMPQWPRISFDIKSEHDYLRWRRLSPTIKSRVFVMRNVGAKFVLDALEEDEKTGFGKLKKIYGGE